MYATDRNYSFLCGVSLYSLLSNNKNVHNNVYIFEKDIGDEAEKFKALEEKFDVEIRFISALDIEKECRKYNMPPFRGGYMAYARLFADRFIDAKRVIYLDCDTLVRGDISKLWNWELGGKVAAAVKDCINRYANLFLSRNLEDDYYNSGVMLIDYDQWYRAKCQNKIIDSLNQIDINKTATYGDQDIINHAIGDLIVTLPPSYNAMYLTRYFAPCKSYAVLNRNESTYYAAGKLYDSQKSSAIVHYAGRNILRPWYVNSILSDDEKKEWHQYKDMSPWKDCHDFENEVGWIKKHFLKFYLIKNPMMLCKIHGYMQRKILKNRLKKIKNWRKYNI